MISLILCFLLFLLLSPSSATFLSQLSLDFCELGVSTLWGSFELQNHRLLKKMVRQYARTDTLSLVTEHQYYFSLFSQLPLYLLRFHGSTSVHELLDAMEYAVYVYDVSHVIIDNLQFMVSDQAYGVSRFDLQDQVISLLRKFATSKNVHISLVIHPRKQNENEHFDMSSVFGGAKAIQEADNIIVLQNDEPGLRHVEVLKNRYDGDLGRVAVLFDKHTNRFREMSADEVRKVREERRGKEEKERAQRKSG